MTDWKFLRLGLLGAAAVGVVGTTTALVLNPLLGVAVPTPYVFPTVVEVAGTTAGSPKIQIIGPPLISPQAEGAYRAGPVTITMRYLLEANGDVGAYTYGSLTPTYLGGGEVRTKSGGQYLLYTQNGQAHLTACINPRGQDTVTAADFEQNRKQLDLTPPRLVAWLLNFEPLYDRRCLWGHLSVPITSTSLAAYSQLESAWEPWAAWWRTHFPKP